MQVGRFFKIRKMPWGIPDHGPFFDEFAMFLYPLLFLIFPCFFTKIGLILIGIPIYFLKTPLFSEVLKRSL